MKREIPYIEYLTYTKDKESFFYNKSNNDLTKVEGRYVVPPYDKQKWHISVSKHWTYVMNVTKDFPLQGWKIHLSTVTSESQLLLWRVASYLMLNEISFKFVSNTNEWLLKISKYGDRAASGKFITVYPTDELDFEKLLHGLEDITKEFSLGPYILNDKQWHNSNVYFRYGGLKKAEAEINGEIVDVIYNNHGEAVEDQRVPYYFVPDFVKEPKFLKENNNVDNDLVVSKIDEFKGISAIHFSNGGGVYSANIHDEKIILKEGRSESGVDRHNRDGFRRNYLEYLTLQQLNDIPEVVDVKDYFIVWRHNYLVEEFIEGKTLKQYIATQFPFYKQSSDLLSKYIDETISILKQIKESLIKIHEKGVAVGDLSLNNVIIKSDGHIKFIDFESSQLINTTFKADIVTPEFYSKEAKTFGDNDWYAFYKIAYYLFLPISSLANIAPSIIYIHDASIKRKFGSKVSDFLLKVREFVAKRTNIFPKSEFLDSQFNVPFERLGLENTNTYKYQVASGIMNNIDSKSDNLIFGDIRQYSSDLGKYNVANGGYGALLSLKRSGYNIQENPDVKAWINKNLSYILNMDYSNKNFGLFSGTLGIAGTLYELGYTTEAHKLFLKSTNAVVEDISDISIYSGLAGIGLAQIYAYQTFGDVKLLDQATDISHKLLKKFENETNLESDYGLLTGWSGVLLFLWEYAEIMSDMQIKEQVIDWLKDIKSYLLEDSSTTAVQVVDRHKNKERVVPYLENGSAGLVLLLLEVKKDITEKMDNVLEEMLIRLQESTRVFSAYNAGLFDGYLGQILVDIAETSITKDSSILEDSLYGMNNYLIQNNNYVLLPGRFGYKFSLDLETGSAGLLALLNDVKTDHWNTWVPIIFGPHQLFSN